MNKIKNKCNNDQFDSSQSIGPSNEDVDVDKPLANAKQNESDQTCIPGILDQNAQSDAKKYIEARSYGYVPVDLIRRNKNVDDFSLSREINHPRVLKYGDVYYEIDNFGLVDIAKNKGESEIYCEIIETPYDDEINRCIQKISSRTRTSGGKVKYAELVKSVKQIIMLIRSQNPDVIEYEHGGNRQLKLKKNDQNSEADLKTILMESLNMKRTTVSKLLQYGRYLNEDALDICIQNQITKKQFEKMESRKKTKIKNLMKSGHNSDEINEIISNKIIKNIKKIVENKYSYQDFDYDLNEGVRTIPPEDETTPPPNNQEIEADDDDSKRTEQNQSTVCNSAGNSSNRNNVAEKTEDQFENEADHKPHAIPDQVKSVSTTLFENENQYYEDREAYIKTLEQVREQLTEIIETVKQMED